jgi:[acyl-carrier-protein] S-malonyltransferase
MKVIQNLVFIFPGQGSQSIGMLSELAAEYPQLVETFDEASSVLGQNLWELVCNGPAEALGCTELTQPLMLTGGFALWRLWTALTDARPAVMAGHSLGEYTALVAAGSLEFSTALRVVAERGRLMQAAVPAGQGAMAAILGLDDEIVEAICREVAEQQVVVAANYNSPGQIVIAGESAAVERAMRACQDAGARRTLKLPLSVPSHCPLMAPAAEQLRTVLADVLIQTPQIPVLHNADLRVHQTGDEIRAALVAQLCAPVRWTDTIRTLRARGAVVLAECGPGRVLSALGKRIDRSLHWMALDTPAGIEALRSLDFSGETTST